VDLAFDFNKHPTPTFHEDSRELEEDPLHAMLSTCSTLLDIVNVGDSAIMQFSHFSGKELLTSTQLANTRDEISHRYHV